MLNCGEFLGFCLIVDVLQSWFYLTSHGFILILLTRCGLDAVVCLIQVRLTNRDRH